MGVHVARYTRAGKIEWGVVREGMAYAVPGDYTSLADFIERGKRIALELDIGADVAIDELNFMSPVTAPCNIICQGLNYGDHLAETGGNAEKPPFNLLFMKAPSSLSGPNDDIVRPRGVRLLDYELELGLVVGSPITKRTTVTRDNLIDYIAGIVISNDVSARDVQIPQGQWFKGKSFRTFCPTGPYLYLLDANDVERLHDLEIRLEVNGEMRQQSNTKQLLYGPAETLTELSGVMDLCPGDLIQTGTPGGVAVSAPSAAVQRVMRFVMNEKKLMKLFVKRQSENPKFLKDGDVLRLTMRSADGAIDLGVMETRVVAES